MSIHWITLDVGVMDPSNDGTVSLAPTDYILETDTLPWPNASAYAQGVLQINAALGIPNGKIMVTSHSGSARPEAVVYAWLRARGMTASQAAAQIVAGMPQASRQYFLKPTLRCRSSRQPV